MFTANPASGSRDEIVIEGAFGLGEAVVSGAVSPDRYLVEKETLAIRRREVHDKELAIEYAPRAAARVSRELAEQERQQPVLERRGDHRRRRARPRGSRSTTANRRTPSGPSTRTARCGCCRAGRSRRCATRRGDRARRRRAATVLLRGLGGAPGSATGPVRVLRSLTDADKLGDGDVLVTHMTSPDWTRADAPRRGDRHRLGRHDLPRRDRLARAGDPLRRRHRRSDPRAARRRGSDRRRDARGGSRGRRSPSRPPRRAPAAASSSLGAAGHRHASSSSTSPSPPRSSA